MVVALSGGLIYLAHYQPLVPGDAGASSMTYRQGAPFSYATELINQGHIPITVQGIDAWTGLLRTTGISIGRSGLQHTGDISPRYYETFRSFSLAPGQSRAILIQNVFEGCARFAPGTSAIYESLMIRFSVLGVPRTALVTIGDNPTIEAPKSCPE